MSLSTLNNKRARVFLKIIIVLIPMICASSWAKAQCIGSVTTVSIPRNIGCSFGPGFDINWDGPVGGNLGSQSSGSSSVDVTWTTTGTFRLKRVFPGGCTGTPLYSSYFTIGNVPLSPTPSPASRCGTGTVDLTGTVGANGNTLNWYDASSGGTLLATADSYTTPSISSTTTYYITTYNSTGGCESSPRIAITATVNPTPSDPTPSPASRCGTGAVGLSGTIGANGNALLWYDSPSGGTLLANATSYTTPSISSTTTYYITSYNSTTGCESSPRVSVVATVNPIPSDPTPSPASRCGTGTVGLSGTIGANGNALRWYDASTGGTLLSSGTSYTTPSISATTTYYITSYNSTTGCESTPRIAITATINPIPANPTPTPGNRCGPGTVVLGGSIGANGNTLRWYDASTGGTLLATASSYTTPSISVTTTYYITSYNTSTGCESTPRFPVTATVNPIPSSPTPSPGNRCGTGTVALGGTPGSGGTTLRWYDASSGGTLLTTGTSYITPSISVTTIYYITTYNGTTGCESTPRVPVAATVNPIPSDPTPAPGSRCGTGTVILGGTPGSGGVTLRWYDASTGGTLLATAPSYTTPSISVTTTYYITSYNSSPGCESTSRVPIVATVTPAPSAPTPSPASRCGTGTVVLGGTIGSGGTALRWYDASTGGTLLATGTSYNTPSISSTTTYYITSYNSSTGCESSPRVPIAATVNPIPSDPTPSPGIRCGTGTVVLTGTIGTNGNTLRWYDASTGGTLLATATNYTTPSISATTNYYFTSYNSSTGCESATRITNTATVNQIPSNPTGSPASRCGTGTVVLNGAPGSGGNTIRWYDASSGGTLLATGTSYTTPSISATTTYYITSYNSAAQSCESTPRVAIVATVNPIPSNPTPSPASRCGTGSVILSGTIGANGNALRWYDASTGGTLLTTATSYTTPNISATTTYYITSYNSTTGCESTPRTPIAATVNPIPSNPTPTPASICGTGTVVLTGSIGANGNTLRWYDASSGGTLLATATSYTTPSISATTTYYITSYNSTTGCEGSPRIANTATVNPTPSNPTPTPASRCGTGTVVLTGSIGANGNTLRWYDASIGGTLLSTATSYTTPSISASTTYYITSYNSTTGCESTPRIANLATINVVPGLPSAAGVTRCNTGTFVLNATVGAGGTGVNWYAASTGGTLLFTGLSFTTPSITSTTTYYIASYTSTCESARAAVTATIVNGGPTSTMNYVFSTAVLVDNITDPLVIDNLQPESASKSVQYFDGLGRVVQSVSNLSTPSKLDIVQPVVYDNFGREYRKYLPFVGDCGGGYKSNIIDVNGNYTGVAANTYANNPTGKIAQDPRPFSETSFEASPLSRPIKNYGPGQQWSTSGSNKFIEHQYLINVHGTTTSATAEKVVAWNVDPASGMPVRLPAVAGYVETSGHFSTGQLSITQSTDEQGYSVREYTNKSGQVILKKVQATTAGSTDLNNTANWALTYYVYDDLGNLRYVFPPELSKLIHNNADTYVVTSTDLTNWAFQYKYDLRKRMTEKQVPGAGIVYMVYDNLDRLVLTQDANQRAASPKYWSFTKYDQLNRPVLMGIKDTTAALTQVQMQGVVNTYYDPAKPWHKYGETFVGSVANNVHGYSNTSYPRTTSPALLDVNRYLTVTYYDNYTFRNLWIGSYNYVDENLTETVNGIPYNQPDAEFIRVAGQVTGTKIKVLDGGVTGGFTWLKSVNYYDDKYRMIQTLTDNYKGGIDRTTNVNDFTGKVLKSKTTHTESDVTWKDLVGVGYGGNILTRTTGTAGAASTQILSANVDGWMEFTVSEINTTRYIGLNDSNPDALGTNIDYAFKLTNTTLTVVENNTTKATVANIKSGDILRIQRTGTAVKYYRNGLEITPLSPASTLSSTQLMVDVSTATANATWVGVRSSFSTTSHAVTRRLEYDHAGRLTRTWHQLDAQPEILLTMNEYNELGQLIDKKLHSTVPSATDTKQSVDYRYNIRGWLTKMNESDVSTSEPGDLFGMELLYDQQDANLGNSQLFNGNISAIKWSNQLSLGTVKENAYTYGYDPLNRISSSNFKEKSGTWSAPANNAFAETGFSYDLNGNITALQRNDKRASGLMDDMTYDYGTGATASNRLLKVTDNGDDFAGFLDGNPGTGTDYTYDGNGNMTTDLNKGISTAITYNFLNLPEFITRGTSNTIRYIYDASGRKLAQVASFNIAIKQTDYVGEYQYENDVLQFLSHEEGRIVVASNKTIFTHSCDVTTNITASTSVLAQVTQNGSTYVRATASGNTAKQGMFPIGGTFTVQAGEQYRIRAKGYRTGTGVVHINIRANGADLNWPGATLASSSSTEAWTEQTVTIPTGATTMQAGVVWITTNNGQQFFLNDFEIVKINTNQTPEYQYNLKDHLGNVRLTFTSKQETITETATLETANAATEQSQFVRYAEARKIQSYLFDRTNGSSPTTNTGYSQRLSGSTNEKYGLGKSISVMPGDVISAEVYAKYVDPVSSNWTAALTTLMGYVANPGSAPAGTVVDGSGYSTSTATFPFPGAAAQNTAGSSESGPKAYLNWLVFDRNFNFILSESGFDRISNIPKETGQDVAHERLFSPQITIKQAGYVYIYLSNEESSPLEVYFDDFNVTQTKSPVIQTDDYYAFGLTFNSYKRENSTINNYLYNSKEKQDALDLGWMDYGARTYMPEIGRWSVIDPLSEKGRRWSPYNYALNNPLRFIDADGMWPDIPGLLNSAKNYVVSKAKEKVIETAKAVKQEIKDFAKKLDIGLYSEGGVKVTMGGRLAAGVKGGQVDINGGSVELFSASFSKDKKGTNGNVNYLSKDGKNKLSFGAGGEFIAGTSASYEETRNKRTHEVEETKSENTVSAGAILAGQVKMGTEETPEQKNTYIKSGATIGGRTGLGLVVEVHIDFGIKMNYSQEK